MCDTGETAAVATKLTVTELALLGRRMLASSADTGFVVVAELPPPLPLRNSTLLLLFNVLPFPDAARSSCADAAIDGVVICLECPRADASLDALPLRVLSSSSSPGRAVPVPGVLRSWTHHSPPKHLSTNLRVVELTSRIFAFPVSDSRAYTICGRL